MDGPYNTSHEQGSGYATGLSINTNNFNHMNLFQPQPLFAGQDHLSPTARRRHDSVNSQMSPHALRLLGGQYQAEPQPQPREQQATPHNNTAYPCQPVAMSRDTSHASHHSSTSSGQQYGDSPHFVPHNSFPNIYSPIGPAMQRSRSAYSNTSTLYSHQISPQSSMAQMFQIPVDHHSPDVINDQTTSFPTIAQYNSTNTPMDNATMNYHLTGVNGVDCGANDVVDIGLSEYLHVPKLLPPPFRQRAVSFGGVPQSTDQKKLVPQAQAPVVLSGASSTSSRSSPPVERKRRPRRHTPPSDPESDKITGHVLASGQFKCAKSECAELRFGRQADFRRHHTNVHAKAKKEYFCTVGGCARSRNPSNKSKGRSFGARKDKMDEHVKAVHLQDSKKRRRSFEPEKDEDEEVIELDGKEEEDAQSDTQVYP